MKKVQTKGLPRIVNRAEFERRFKARIVERLTSAPHSQKLSREKAESMANNEWASRPFEEHSLLFEEDPEGSADEALTCWQVD